MKNWIILSFLSTSFSFFLCLFTKGTGLGSRDAVFFFSQGTFKQNECFGSHFEFLTGGQMKLRNFRKRHDVLRKYRSFCSDEGLTFESGSLECLHSRKLHIETHLIKLIGVLLLHRRMRSTYTTSPRSDQC